MTHSVPSRFRQIVTGAHRRSVLSVFFEIGEERFPVVLIRAFGLQKYAAARASAQCGAPAPELASAIEKAAIELHDGRWDEHFPLTIWQTGSGTQTNMNSNEVIANRANELLGQPQGTKAPVIPTIMSTGRSHRTTAFPR